MSASEISTGRGFAVVIDGPVASGKGTIAKRLATEFDGFHMNTGLMYRALTLFCIDSNIELTDVQGMLEALKTTQFTLKEDAIDINGQDMTKEVREQRISDQVTTLAAIADVRSEMVRRQRELGDEKMEEGQVVIIDARDGYVIFPDAPVRIYLTASVDVRAQRRMEQQPTERSFEEVKASTIRRDADDMERSASPLLSQEAAKEKGYIIIDSSDMNEDQTVAAILESIHQV